MQQIKFPCPECADKRHDPALHYVYPFCTFCCGIGIKYISANSPTGFNRERARIAWNRHLNAQADF